MARITTKEYVAARQMKKNGDCISGDKPGGTVFFCVMALVQKTDNYWTSTYTFFENRVLSIGFRKFVSDKMKQCAGTPAMERLRSAFLP